MPHGETISFQDGHFGLQSFMAGKDFGDFVVWRHDDVPSYQLAVVADDAAMQITEVVRGADLLLSTARQLLLYRALGFIAPQFFHCPLMLDEHGERLAKRHAALSVRALRDAAGMVGVTAWRAQEITAAFQRGLYQDFGLNHECNIRVIPSMSSTKIESADTHTGTAVVALTRSSTKLVLQS